MQGEEVITPIYQWVSNFEGGYCIVKYQGRYGVIDGLGEIIIEPKFRNISFYTYGFVTMTDEHRKKRLYNLISRKEWGHSYSSINFLQDSIYLVTNENYQFGLCDSYGKEIVPTKYDTITSDLHFFLGLRDSSYTDYYDFSGTLIFDKIDSYEEWNSSDTLILYKDELVNLYSRQEGKMLLGEWNEQLAPLFNPLISIANNDKWGVFNLKSQRFIIPQIYEQIAFPNKEYILGDKLNIHHLYRCSGELLFESNDHILFINKDLVLTTSDYLEYTFYYLPEKTRGATIHTAVLSIQKNGLIVFKEDNQKGIVNRKGHILLPAEFNKVNCDGNHIKAIRGGELVLLSLGKDQSIIDRQEFLNYRSIEFEESPQDFMSLRNIVSQPIRNSNTQGSFQTVFSPSVFRVNPLNEIVLPQTGQTLRIYRKKVKGLVTYGLLLVLDNEKNRKLTKADYSHIDLRDYTSGEMAKAILQGGRNCFLHYTGKIIYSGEYLNHGKYETSPFAFIGEFNNDLAPVNVDGSLYPNQRRSQLDNKLTIDNVSIIRGLWGFYNRNGEQVVKASFKKVTKFENKRAFVLSKGWGMISVTGDTIVEPVYHSLKYLDKDKNLVVAGIKKQLYGLASPDGTILSPTMYSKIEECGQGFFQVKKNRLWGYVDRMGDEVISCQFTRSTPFGRDNLAAVKTRLLWGFIDTLGTWFIEPTYVNAEPFENGTAVVKNKKGYGVINLLGEWVIEPRYKKIKRAGDGLYWIKKGQKFGLTDAEGKWIMTPQFEVVYPFDKNGIAKVKSSGAFQSAGNSTGLVNREGKVILKTKYRPSVKYISDSLIVFQEEVGFLSTVYRKGIIDIHGNIVVKPKFTKLFRSSKNTVAMRSKGEFYVYSIMPFKLLFRCKDIKPGKADFVIYKGKKISGWLARSEDQKITYEILSSDYIYGSTSDNKLIMKRNGVWTMFDLYTRQVAGTEIQQVIANYYKHITVKLSTKGFVKLIDDNQHLLIEGDYNGIKQMKSGFYLLGQKWHYGIFDRAGNEISPCKADQIKYLDGLEIIQVRIGKKLNYLHLNGNWIR